MSDVATRAKAALEAVGDEGPWTIDSEDGEPIIHEAHHYDSTDEWYDVDGSNGGWVAHCEDLATAEFIAAARTLVPELIAEVERKSDQLAEWRAQYDAIDAENERLRADVQRLTPRRIETVEELDALPPEAVIKTEGGSIACRHYSGVGIVFGDDRPFPWTSSLSTELPGVLLWHPENGAGDE